MIVVALCGLFFQGLNYGVDFSGGRNYVVRFDQSVETEDVRELLEDAFDGAGVQVISIGTDNQVRISTKYRIQETGEQVDHEIITLLYENLKPMLAEGWTLEQFENKIIKKENINVLVSSNTCYFCIQFEPIVEETLKDSGKTIYKIDIAKMSEKEVKRFREYYAFTITPTIFTVKDGIVTSEKLGSMDAETLSVWANENLQ
jgi:predicted bacteriocin transport accessory protein